MKSQAETVADAHNFQKVVTHFLDPLQKIYSKQMSDYLITAYVEDLADYSVHDLTIAAKEIRRERKYMPSIADAIEACEKAKRMKNTNRSSTKPEDYKNPWDERREIIEKNVAAYMEHFQNTHPIYYEALSGGWEIPLARFVHAVAMVQAQMIEKIPNGIGWHGGEIFGYGATTTPEEARVWLDEQWQIADRGYIDVGIPTGRMEEFKRWKAPSMAL